MKKIYYLMLTAILVLNGCTDKMQGVSGDAYSNETLYAFTPGGGHPSRVEIQKPDGNGHSAILWSKGDSFVAFNENYESANYLLKGEGNVATGEFRTENPLEGSLHCAVFPKDTDPNVAGGLLTLNLRNHYSIADNSQNSVMWGTIDGNKVTFQHLMAVLKMDFSAVPNGYTTVKVVTSNIIAGKFKMDLSSTARKLTADNESIENRKVTIDMSDGNSLFYLPLPAGDYKSIKIYATNGTGTYSMLDVTDKTLATGLMYTAKSLTEGKQMAQAWEMFDNGSLESPLLDYSYAGYEHGEMAPPEVTFPVGSLTGTKASNGYTIYNVKQKMEEEGCSARDALFGILLQNKLIRPANDPANKSNFNANAKIVVYFPEKADGYVFREDGEDVLYPILGGNLIIKGDGPDKTRIVLKNQNIKNALIEIKHTIAPTAMDKNVPLLSTVTENATKGAYCLTVNNAAALKKFVGKYVILRIRSGNTKFLAEELGPLSGTGSDTWTIKKQPDINGDKDGYRNGIKFLEIHQIDKVEGNKVYFYEPVTHDINIEYNDFGGWEIRQYKYIEHVGVEGIKFVGNGLTPFYHHGDGAPSGSNGDVYDRAYCPLTIGRAVNSWVRDLEFESVSEAMTFNESAFCSAYNIKIYGNRGHSAVRAAGSTRIFIGKVQDNSCDGKATKYGTIGKGQWHGCGVSKPSVGNVIWNCNWGDNACFESHATQPRATLFDCCTGGLLRYHSGGAESEAPNHLADLTLWNLNVTGTVDEKNNNFSNNFSWWDKNNRWWKIYPPVVVGTHGQQVTFSGADDQLTYEESTGTMVSPQSLYEAQMERRLGGIPAWLKGLK